MEPISSRMTFYYKRIFPLIWFGFLAFMAVTVFAASHESGGPPPFVLVVLALMALVGAFIMKKLVWDLADEVLDGGDALVVRFGDHQERIPLADIMNVSYAWVQGPPRVTLTLRTAGKFGNELSFAAPNRFIPFAKSPVIVDLIQRVDAARQTTK
ncbi:MAG TPA: hypothetical protein VME18_12200 [Acidobacteriaceae bacterium]|nr:hypothetical protein [Acidobacteriaceae bacterium]